MIASAIAMGGKAVGTDLGFKEAIFNQERRSWAGPGEAVDPDQKAFALTMLEIDGETFDRWEAAYVANYPNHAPTAAPGGRKKRKLAPENAVREALSHHIVRLPVGLARATNAHVVTSHNLIAESLTAGNRFRSPNQRPKASDAAIIAAGVQVQLVAHPAPPRGSGRPARKIKLVNGTQTSIPGRR